VPELVFGGFAVLRSGAARGLNGTWVGVGVSCDVIGSCGFALGEVDRAADEVGNAMVSRRDVDRPVAGSDRKASLRRRAVMRGPVVVRGVVVRLVLAGSAIGH
jgi:hypothetical protein